MKKVSIVIGLYNSAKTIEAVLEEIDKTFRESPDLQYEVILVDDKSPDNVYEIVKQCAARDNRIKVIHLAKNSGQTSATMEGYRFVTGDYVVAMDDDLQMPAKEILRMINHLEEGDYDVVFAKYLDQKESPFRLFGSRVNNKMTQIMLGKPKNIRVNSFFVMRRFIAEGITKYASNYPYTYGIIFALTDEVEHRPRAYGTSNYTFLKLISLWMNGFLNFSVKPLRVAIVLGTLITLASFVFASILIISRLLNPTQYIGWTSIMVAIIFFSGVLLLGIGIVGEYVGRLFISSSGLPRATIRETINIDNIEE